MIRWICCVSPRVKDRDEDDQVDMLRPPPPRGKDSPALRRTTSVAVEAIEDVTSI